MIRKIFMLGLTVFIFMYITWNFYSQALRYDPLLHVTEKKYSPLDSKGRMLDEISLSWSKEIFSKNLFNPQRSFDEKPPIPVGISVVDQPVRPLLSLKGIVLEASGDYVAFVEINNTPALPLRKGDKTENIELLDISGREVVLKWNAETIKLTMGKIRTINVPRVTK